MPDVNRLDGHPAMYTESVVHRWRQEVLGMRRDILILGLICLPGCKLFGALEEARDLLEEPVTMQGLVVGLEVPDGIETDGTLLEIGAQAQAWVQRTTTNGVGVVDGAKVSLVSDRRGSVKLVQDEATWSADGRDGLAYLAGDEVRLVVDYGGERGSISMELPAGPVLNLPEDHTPGVGIPVSIQPQAGEPDFDNGGVIVYELLSGEIVWESDYDVEEPVDPENLEITVPGETFQADGIYAVGVVGLMASGEDDLFGLNPLGSGMLVGQMVVGIVSTFDL